MYIHCTCMWDDWPAELGLEPLSQAPQAAQGEPTEDADKKQEGRPCTASSTLTPAKKKKQLRIDVCVCVCVCVTLVHTLTSLVNFLNRVKHTFLSAASVSMAAGPLMSMEASSTEPLPSTLCTTTTKTKSRRYKCMNPAFLERLGGGHHEDRVEKVRLIRACVMEANTWEWSRAEWRDKVTKLIKCPTRWFEVRRWE